MPDAIEPQLDELRRRARRRLVGAVVLALAAAVLVPMLLESDPKPLGEDVSVKIPPVDEGKFVEQARREGASRRKRRRPRQQSRRPAPVPSRRDAATAAAAKDASREPVRVRRRRRSRRLRTPLHPRRRRNQRAKEAPAPASEGFVAGADAIPQAAADAVRRKPAPDAPSSDFARRCEGAQATGGAFSVQLAAFSDDKGANALANRLKKAGHPAYTEPYATSQGTLWRVRVGPYATREAAEAARTKLKADGQNGIIAAAN